jgi:hypothetical protein
MDGLSAQVRLNVIGHASNLTDLCPQQSRTHDRLFGGSALLSPTGS